MHSDKAEARLLSIAMVGAVIEEDIDAVNALAPAMTEDAAHVITTLVTLLSTTLKVNLGEEGARQQLDLWRASVMGQCED